MRQLNGTGKGWRKRMKIVIAIQDVFGGGAERVVSILAKEFTSKGHEITIMCLNDIKFSEYFDMHIKKEKLEVEPCRGFSYFKRLRKAERILKRAGSDIVIIFSNSMLYILAPVCRRVHIPVIVSERSDPVRLFGKSWKTLYRNWLYRFVDGAVFQTAAAGDYYKGYLNAEWSVIPNPISRSIPEKTLWTDRVVAVARLEPVKNIPMLIDAFADFSASHEPYRLDIYGTGSLEAPIQQYIAQKGLSEKVFLKGYRTDVFSEILDAGMLVISSDYEGLSNAMLEAMAIGIPVISTDYPSGGAREFIEDGVNGYLVLPGDAKGLSEKMADIADRKEVQRTFSEKGMYVREALSVEHISAKWLEYIIKIRKNYEKNKSYKKKQGN